MHMGSPWQRRERETFEIEVDALTAARATPPGSAPTRDSDAVRQRRTEGGATVAARRVDNPSCQRLGYVLTSFWTDDQGITWSEHASADRRSVLVPLGAVRPRRPRLRPLLRADALRDSDSAGGRSRRRPHGPLICCITRQSREARPAPHVRSPGGRHVHRHTTQHGRPSIALGTTQHSRHQPPSARCRSRPSG